VSGSIDIVIPVLDEARTLEKQILVLTKFLKNQAKPKFNYQITIADNGSSDDTLAIAKNLAFKFQNIRAVSVGERGVGLALKTAWQKSKCDFVGYMDLDFSTELNHLFDVEKLLLEDYDCVFGSRLLPKSVVIGRTFRREITSRVFNVVVRRIFRTTTSDAMCGFKFMKRKALNHVLDAGASCDRWFFCAEIAVASQLSDLRVIEVPVLWKDDGLSKVKIPSLTLEYISDILSFKRRIKISHVGKKNFI